ncbi:FtsX-like permease family protein [Stakelama sp. CBK3Z-3]|uniref:FtsX-like permease family protein n=1 Tax=Stakelama flava TaxID=2860338 RepID=A0ABS6XIZ5_9SPHN|nr:FtsX-like permease family protein [Stakelama flava]MBW4330111.1 FtsX-like permease family protein [Stakelama flava]
MALGPSAPARRLLDDNRRTLVMVWIMAIMIFLTVLAAGLGLGTVHAATSLDNELAGRLTVQVVEADTAARDAATAAILDRLEGFPGVKRVEQVPPERLNALLKPWLGEAGLDADLPMPTMIDVDLSDASDAMVARISAIARQASDHAVVDRHATWLSPVRDFLTTLMLLALALIILMLIATGAVVLLAARTGLDTHRDTIEVLHMLGSTDIQVARLFQRRIALETLIGGVIGTLAALALCWFLQMRLALLGSGAISGMVLEPRDWLILAAIPFLFALLAMLAARLSVQRALGRTL